MGMLGGLNAWKAKSNREKARIQARAGDFVRDKVKKVLREALMVSPQWSGDFASNWEIVTNINGRGGKTRRFKIATGWQDLRGIAYKVGDRPAIAWAMWMNEEVISSIKWNTNVSIVNNADIAEDMEAGRVKLRPENAGAKTAILVHLQEKFPFIRKNN